MMNVSMHNEVAARRHVDVMPNYRVLADDLIKTQAPVSASQAHGLMCACICAGKRLHGVPWLSRIMGIARTSDQNLHDLRACLLDMYAFSSEQLQNMAFDYQLFLPDDDESLRERAYALSSWCRGFMEGFTLLGGAIGEEKSPESSDILFHLSETAKLDYDMLHVSEADEKAYFELSEYIRMAVLMLYQNMV